MPFDPSTKDRLMGVLRWPVSSKNYLDYLQELMTDVETYGGLDAIARIETLLSDYDDAKEAQLALRNSTQATMTRADVVEWDPKLGIASGRRAIADILKDIRAALGASGDPFGWVAQCRCETQTLRLRKG